MKRREYEVTRFGRFESDLGGFEIAHLADQDHLWSLTQGGTQGRGKILCIRTDLTLIYRGFFVVVQKLDRVLDRDDMIRLGLVYTVDDRGERRAFSGTRRACEQNNAVADL